MTKYRKKPVVIEAIQWTGNNYAEIREFCGVHPQGHGHCWYSVDDREFVGTLEGEMEASIDDYIIKGIKNEFYPCKPDVFLASYEPVIEANVSTEELANFREEWNKLSFDADCTIRPVKVDEE